EIDDLNVYPVPDGDTGTNMTLTAQAAADALRSSPAADPKGCLGALARGAVLGARGNSGVILSQILCGLADACPPPAAGRPALEAWVPGQPVPGRPDLGPPVPDQAALGRPALEPLVPGRPAVAPPAPGRPGPDQAAPGQPAAEPSAPGQPAALAGPALAAGLACAAGLAYQSVRQPVEGT